MSTTARFELERRTQLESLFAPDRLVKLWRELVKDQMRRFDITDLYDYYDFNYDIEAKVKLVIERVLAGRYRADPPLMYRLEKKLGICRQMMIPTPSDALVFQVLTDALFDAIQQAQPSKNAFYARDRHTSLKLPHEQRNAGSYPWFVLWRVFQKKILGFTRDYPFLVTTDLTNYFDSIGLRELRHVISAMVNTREVYLDLLFSLVEDLSWKPDYLPTAHRGMPTINIEAPRLLAHALLFEIDNLLKDRTGGDFVRWMDDINFGVNDVRTAKTILGEMNDVLKSRGLSLNLSKTAVMTSDEAEHHFLFRENLRLTETETKAKALTAMTEKALLASQLVSELRSHMKDCTARNKDKVTKRYLTILGRLGVAAGLQEAVQIYVQQPGLRSSVLAFLSRLPFSSELAAVLLQLLDETDSYDDATRFGYVSSLVHCQVPHTALGLGFARSVLDKLAKPKAQFEWLCWIRFLSKYGEPYEIMNAVLDGDRLGLREPFFARQRATALARCIDSNTDAVIELWEKEAQSGCADAASVASSLLRFSVARFPKRNDRLSPYLFPANKQDPYPISKFLLLCVLAHREKVAGDATARPEIAEHVADPWYRHWIGSIHPIWAMASAVVVPLPSGSPALQTEAT